MKNAIKNLLLIMGFVLLLALPQSCLKEYSDLDKISKTPDYSPSVAGALANAKLTVRDIIRDYDKDELFEEGADGFLYLMYNKKAITKTADELISLPNQDFFPTLDVYTGDVYNNLSPNGAYREFPQLSIPNLFNVSNQEQLDSIRFDAMDVNVVVNSTFDKEGILTITFPTLKKNNTPLVITVNPDNTGNFHMDSDTHIEGYTLGFDAGNNVLAEFDLSLRDGTNADASDMLDVTISMNNLDFDAIYGYVGRISTPIPQDTINISIFDNAFDGEVWFKNPNFILNVSNSFGLPITNYFGDLQSFSHIEDDNPGSGTWITYDDFPIDVLEVNYPTQLGEVAHQQELLNANNFPSIQELIASKPKYLLFEVDSVVINPNGYDQTITNFVSDTSSVSVDLSVNLPLEGNALYSLVDTLDLDIEENFDDISKHFVEANLRVVFNSLLPTNVYAQVIFTDSLFNPISQLYDDSEGKRMIASAVLNNQGKAIQSTQEITDIVFGNGSNYERDINDLNRVKKAIVIATLKTNDAGVTGATAPISKFYAENYLEVKIGVKGQGKYEEPLN